MIASFAESIHESVEEFEGTVIRVALMPRLIQKVKADI
jgi:hypothetical protein